MYCQLHVAGTGRPISARRCAAATPPARAAPIAVSGAGRAGAPLTLPIDGKGRSDHQAQLPSTVTMRGECDERKVEPRLGSDER